VSARSIPASCISSVVFYHPHLLFVIWFFFDEDWQKTVDYTLITNIFLPIRGKIFSATGFFCSILEQVIVLVLISRIPFLTDSIGYSDNVEIT